MGLDMYLYARKYFPSRDLPSKPTQYDNVKELMGIQKDFLEPEFGHAYVDFNVAYWRKANAIHGWFVRQVQDEADDCHTYYVSKENLKDLLDTCKKVKENPDLAKSLLPPSEGFFFGGTEIDEWYFQDIDDTIKQIENCIDLFDISFVQFVYRASW